LFFFDFGRLEQSFCSFLRFQKVVGLIQLAELGFVFVDRAVFQLLCHDFTLYFGLVCFYVMSLHFRQVELLRS
jgi:hypothetical protein